MTKLELITIGAVATIFVLFFLLLLNSNTTESSKSNLEVVDTYKGCDVVRYTDPWGSKYHYFLDCSKK